MSRKLSVILDDIDAVLKSDTANVINIGTLLIEAKAQVEHGEWLPLLRKRFDFSERTARNYISAAKYAAEKSATIADLKLSPSVLYALAGRQSIYLEVEDRILKAAETERVDGDRAQEIWGAWVKEQEPRDTEPEPQPDPQPQPNNQERGGVDNVIEPDPGRWIEQTADQAAEEEARRAEQEAAEDSPEASAERHKAEYADADPDDEKRARERTEPEPRTVIAKATVLTLVEQISAIHLAVCGTEDENGWIETDGTADIADPDLELYDKLLSATEMLDGLAHSLCRDKTVAEQLDARREAKEAERRVNSRRPRRAKTRAERSLEVRAKRFGYVAQFARGYDDLELCAASGGVSLYFKDTDSANSQLDAIERKATEQAEEMAA